MAAPRELLAAYRKYGNKVNEVAAGYTNPVTGRPLSGRALLAKLVQGESGHRGNAVSSAGARGYGQFMPQTRQAVLKATGGKVDPWRSADDAVEAAVLHLTGALGHRKGLEGYNPGGGQGYVNYILGQKVGDLGSRSGTSGGSRGGSGGDRPAREGSYRTVTTPGVDRSGERQAAKLAYLAERGRPGALIGLKQQLDSLADTAPVSRRVRVEGDSSPERPSGARGGSTRPYEDLAAIEREADRIDAAKVPYLWGGGHSGKQERGSKVTPLDCSGAVSRVLGIDPRVSGQFTKFGSPGRAPKGRGVTLYANEGHILMEINGKFWGTSKSNPGGGAGWIPASAVSKDYLSKFTARHIKATT